MVAHSRLIVARQSPMTHMAHDAHHLNGIPAYCGDPKTPADSIFPREGMLGHHLINDDDQRTVDAILLIEESAFQKRQTHYLQVIRSHSGRQCFRSLVGRRRNSCGPVAEDVLSSLIGIMSANAAD